MLDPIEISDVIVERPGNKSIKAHLNQVWSFFGITESTVDQIAVVSIDVELPRTNDISRQPDSALTSIQILFFSTE